MKRNEERVSDEALVARAQLGDQQAREELMFRYWDLVRKLARGFFLADGETEDLIQEGMMGLFQATTGFNREKNGAFKTFAYTCIHRRIIDAVRVSSKKSREMESDFETDENGMLEIDPEELIVISDEHRELMKTMSRALSDFEFKIFSMYIDGMTTADICDSTGKPYKSVDNAIQRSKKKMQALLRK